jgi:Fe-S cluster biogenesis protein NfuA
VLIETRPTPNPNTLQFFPGRTVAGDLSLKFHLSFVKGDECEQSPLAKRILLIEGVTSVYLARDFISVSKIQSIDWYILKPVILGVLMEHYVNGYPIVYESSSSSLNNTQENNLEINEISNKKNDTASQSIIEQIKDIIEKRVRPAVAMDGGDISFDSFVDGIVYLKMHGACSGCPKSTLTLKAGIENMLKHYIAEIKEVREVGT